MADNTHQVRERAYRIWEEQGARRVVKRTIFLKPCGSCTRATARKAPTKPKAVRREPVKTTATPRNPLRVEGVKATALVTYPRTPVTSCVESHQIIAGMMTDSVSRPAAAAAARPAFVR